MAENAALRAVRLLDLVPYLRAHPGVSIAEVARVFEITVPELMKDLNLLFLCGLPGYTPLELIDISFDDGVIVVKDPQNLDMPRRFSEEEALVVRIALAALEDSVPHARRSKVEELRRKVTSIFQSEIPDSALIFRGDRAKDNLAVIQRAIANEKRVRIKYANPTKNEVTERTITPHRIEVEGDRTLIESWCDLATGRRRFNLANIESVVLTEESAHAETESTDSSKRFAEIAVASSSWFHREHQKELIEIGEAGDGISRYRVEVFQDEWLVRSVIASAGAVRIEEPEALNLRVRDLAAAALAQYQRSE